MRQPKFNEKKYLLKFFTSQLNLPKPARRCWLQEYADSEEITTFGDISHRSVVYVSTKGRPKERSKDTIEANLGKISDDLKLIDNFIETRKELQKMLFATPAVLRNGFPVEIKPRSKCFRARLDYEAVQRQKVNFYIFNSLMI